MFLLNSKNVVEFKSNLKVNPDIIRLRTSLNHFSGPVQKKLSWKNTFQVQSECNKLVVTTLKTLPKVLTNKKKGVYFQGQLGNLPFCTFCAINSRK